MPRKSPSADWARYAEEVTRKRKPKNVTAASRTYLKELSRDEQMALAEEIVETRASELCRAYRNVVDVSFGYKRRLDSKSGKKRIVRTPCVTFVVKSKWRGRRDTEESLPKHLFAYWKIGRTRKLCAVPTDVEPASEFARAQPQAAVRARIAVKDATTGRGIFGATTCAVQREGDSSLYALSCRHVFSISDSLHQRRVVNAEVRLQRKDGEIFARTVGVRGPLADAPTVSFDAQLARVNVNMIAQFRATLAGMTFSKRARGVRDIPDKFWINTPRSFVKGGRRRQVRVRAEKLRFVFDRIIIYPGVGRVQHAMLIESQVAPATLAGDSGSPAVTHISGGMLLGMHIAGGRGLSYLIPAWQILAPANYKRPNDSWKLVNV